jgi:hypothetical protein
VRQADIKTCLADKLTLFALRLNELLYREYLERRSPEIYFQGFPSPKYSRPYLRCVIIASRILIKSGLSDLIVLISSNPVFERLLKSARRQGEQNFDRNFSEIPLSVRRSARNHDVRTGGQFISFVGDFGCEHSFQHKIGFIRIVVTMQARFVAWLFS